MSPMPALKKPVTLVWNDALMTHVPEIDEQHKILVHTLNEAAEKLGTKASLDVLEKITQDLLSYALYHFETEEVLIRECGYDAAEGTDSQQHLDEHRRFSGDVVKVRNKLKAGILTPSEELFVFLNDWLSHHILHTDRQLASFILARRGIAP